MDGWKERARGCVRRRRFGFGKEKSYLYFRSGGGSALAPPGFSLVVVVFAGSNSLELFGD